MKKICLLVCVIGISIPNLFATTFSKANSLGQTLYYQTINSSSVYVIKPTSGTYANLTGTVLIPSTVYYNGTTYSVTRVGANAFKDCAGITEFDLPNGIEQLNAGSFSGCTGLTFIDLPNYLQKINGAFSDCTNLQYVSMPSGLKSITGNAFENCISLEYLEIPASVSKIEGKAFAGAGLSSFNVASGSTHYRVLNDGALVSYNGDTLIAYPPATSATSYNLTGPYHIIGMGAFYNNNRLQQVVLGDNVEQILTSAFEGCESLTNATLGENIYNIGTKAFYNCISLNTLIIRATTPPEIASNSFTNVPLTCQIFVPCASQNAYHSNSTFIHYPNIEGLFDYDIDIRVNDETRGRVDILTEPTCEYPELLLEAVPFAGYRFVRWSDNCPDAMRSIDVEGDINLTAYFTAQTNGIDDIEKQDVLISTTNKSIVINMSQSQKVGIYNIQGQIVYEGQEKNLTLPIKAGVYLVKINGIRGKTVVVF